MEASKGNYDFLIKKIDEFIRKYYLNQVIRGSIYLAASLAASYILVTLAEYYGHFNPAGRTVLFYTFLAINAAILIRQIISPFASYLRLGKSLTHEQAALIIGRHFSNVQDKLLNILQLQRLANETASSHQLIRASIDQKIKELKPIPFASAIKISENRRYLKYAVAPLAIILLITFTAPAIFSESTERLIQHSRVFIKKAPFQFVILNKKLNALQGNDFELQVKLTGNEIPGELYLEDGVNTFKLEKENIIRFRYTFRNLQQDKKIRLRGGEYLSDEYTIRVKQKPAVLNFSISLRYPAYLNKKNETLSNTGDLTVPAGTQVTWKATTKNSERVAVQLGKKVHLAEVKNNRASFAFRAFSSLEYSIMPENSEVQHADKLTYQLQVIPDLSPAIEVNERRDSLDAELLYFAGRISDDHGFSRLTFHYRILDEKQKAISQPVNFNKNSLQSSFLYGWNVRDAGLKPGQQLEYYFEVWDNDGANGPKASRSAVKVYRALSEKETEQHTQAASASLKQTMQEAIRDAAQLERETKQLHRELLDKKDLSYTERKKIEQLAAKRRQLEQLVDDIKKENQKNSIRQQTENMPLAIQEKQKQIENLFNNVLDEETKKLLQNLEKLLEQQNKNNIQSELSKMQLDNQSLGKELDRILELYKQLEFEQTLSRALNTLKMLAEKQQELSKQSQEKNVNVQQLETGQQNLSDDFQGFREALTGLEEKNKQLERQNNFQNPIEEQQQIEKLLQESSKNIQNKNLKKLSQNQQHTAEQMQQLANKLQQMQQESESEESQVNIKSLRKLLNQLLSASFEQESMMQKLRKTAQNDPAYGDLAKSQKQIKDNLEMVQDSLYALSKRVPQIQSVVNKEITAINYNLGKAIENLSERKTAEAASNQQYTMTAINNVALLLSEVYEQLQKAMQNAQAGGKGKKQSLSQLRKMQEQLNKNMENARQQMQREGQSKATGTRSGMSEQLARMARQQQLIREALREINRDLNKDGQGRLGNLDELSKEMEQTETDLVNKKIRQETIFRQQEILTKLLDAERAEQERETENKRESRPGLQQTYSTNPFIENYKKEKQKELEMLKTISPALNSFYKIKVGDYLKLLNSGN